MENYLRGVHKAILIGWSRRYFGMLIAVIAFVGFVGFAFIAKNNYKSETRVFIQSNSVIRPLLNGVSIHYDDISDINVLEKTILSEENINKLLKKVHFPGDNTPDGHIRNAENIRNNIKITEISKGLFEISYVDKIPARTQKVVDEMVNILSEDVIGRNSAEMEAANTFIDGQIALYEDKLRNAERRRADFRTLFMDVLPDELNGGLSHLDMIRQQIRELKTEIADEQAKLVIFNKNMADTPEYIAADAAEGNLIFGPGQALGEIQHDANPALTEAKLRLRQLETRFTDEYPEVISQKNLILSLESGPIVKNTYEEPARGNGNPTAPSSKTDKKIKNPEYVMLKNKVVDAETAIATETRHLDEETAEEKEIAGRLQKEPMVQAEYSNLNRDYGIIKDNYEKLLDRREQLHISIAAGSGAQGDKLEIVQKAAFPEKPLFPMKKISLLLAAPASIIAGIAASLFFGHINRGYLCVEELHDMDIYIIGNISAPRRHLSRLVHEVAPLMVAVFVLIGLELSLYLFLPKYFT